MRSSVPLFPLEEADQDRSGDLTPPDISSANFHLFEEEETPPCEIWGHAGSRKTLAIKYLLSADDMGAFASIGTFVFESYDLLPRGANGYPITIVSFVLGGAIEPVLSHYPRLNQMILPWFSGIKEFLVSSSSKIAGTIILLCPTEHVGDQYFISPECIRYKGAQMASYVPLILTFGGVAGYAAFWTKRNACAYHRWNLDELGTQITSKDSLKVFFAAAKGVTSVFSAISALNYSLTIMGFAPLSPLASLLPLIPAGALPAAGVADELLKKRATGANGERTSEQRRAWVNARRRNEWISLGSDLIKYSVQHWFLGNHFALFLGAVIWSPIEGDRMWLTLPFLVTFNMLKAFDLQNYRLHRCEILNRLYRTLSDDVGFFRGRPADELDDVFELSDIRPVAGLSRRESTSL